VTLYIHSDFRGKGIGALLFNATIDEARKRSFHTIIGKVTMAHLRVALAFEIDTMSVLAIVSMENTATLFWEKHGFERVGLLKEVGKKFGRWLDVGVYQFML
jgi:L-amino acid N-acyltransferase